MRKWLFNHIDFSTYPFYGGGDLGVFWSPEKTLFKIWAPTANAVELRMYENGKDGKPVQKKNLKPYRSGVWYLELKGNLEGLFYTFKINDGEWLHEVPDIYARCVGVNGLRGQIYNPRKTNPEGWENDKGPVIKNTVEAIIYETHIRDFSIAESSGIKNKGKYQGFTESGTRSPEGMTTGLDHLKELGITHVHLMPVFDFYTIDEEDPLSKYNWGYDPQNYNSPEGSYSINPYDGSARIKELKTLVKTLHDNGIGVIMDVVYNHTGRTRGSVFNQTVPGYFYRQKPDGTFANASGCGNEVATERSMARKYIIDSLKYWATEFHIDGFRFDLMGIYDFDTVSFIRQEMDKINPGIMLYGEGWAADLSPMAEEKRAVKSNIRKLQGVAAFSDDMRDALKGHWSDKKNKGFVSGLTLREEAVKFGITGATYHPQIIYDYIETSPSAWAKEPDQCINYVSCHDNYTLWDKLKLSNKDASDEELKRMVKLAGAIILTSQGIPFLHSGVEFCRTKDGNENSYKSPDSVNQLDWSRKSDYSDVFEYFKRLILLRKQHPAFRMPTSEQIKNNLKFCKNYQTGVVAYSLNGKNVGDFWHNIIVIFNGNPNPVNFNLPKGIFQILLSEDNFYTENTGITVKDEISVKGTSVVILNEIS
ncbi:MAG: type I pullulanase [Prolixibacteraceae bacterium]|nr:type I pullulanase [Prolixibacteraceae bacterium]MBN2775102.1 type I pullulanase [Prolixibacteraceae bacterium]